jgi:tetratricopeptide (TPR) repeat protein
MHVCVIILLFATCLVVTSRLLIRERQMRNDMTVAKAAYEAKLLIDAGQASRGADKYVEALELQKKLFGLDKPRAAELFGSAFGSLMSLGRTEDANRLLTRFYIPPRKSPSSDWLGWRAALFARQARWREAREDVTMGLKTRPDYVVLYHALATLLVAENDIEALPPRLHGHDVAFCRNDERFNRRRNCQRLFDPSFVKSGYGLGSDHG